MTLPQPAELTIYVGTYTLDLSHAVGKGEGIYICRLDLASGALSRPVLAARTVNPSFLTLDAPGRHLYAAEEVGYEPAQPAGSVSAFARDAASGDLTPLNRQPSHGAAPCHLSLDRTGRVLLVANYASGSVAVLPIETDGSLRRATDLVQHHGSSVHPVRQQGPHAHSITPDPANRHAIVADLGLDQLLIYRLDAASGRLTPNASPAINVRPGAGPRHVAFHPNGRRLYAVNELDCTVSAYTYDPERGGLAEFQTVSTLPDGFAGRNTCADIHVHPSGAWLYVSNRGHDSLAVFAIEPATGRLRPVAHEPSGGAIPRNFALDPTGAYLLAANQNSDRVAVFRLDPGSGRPTPTGHTAPIPSPVCVVFAPPCTQPTPLPSQRERGRG